MKLITALLLVFILVGCSATINRQNRLNAERNRYQHKTINQSDKNFLKLLIGIAGGCVLISSK